MSSYLKVLILLGSLTLLYSHTLYALNEFRSSIFQIISYTYDSHDQIYIPEKYGSSISIPGGLLITNAHVVLDNTQEPRTAFEVCGVQDKSGKPKCFSSASLLYYDPDIDLAMLRIEMPYSTPTIRFATQDLGVGAVVLVKGFPSYGLGTVTTTRGVLAGEYGDYQKIDADLDHGNSGGGAFDEQFRLSGIPTFSVQGSSTLGYMIPLSKIQDFIAKKGVIMYPSSTSDPQFRTYLRQKQRQLSSKIIKDKHFQLVVPQGFYIQDMIQTLDQEISLYQLSSPNQNISIDISTQVYPSGWHNEFAQNKDSIIQEAQANYNDVSYTQSVHQSRTQDQLIVQGTESDKFYANVQTRIYQDPHTIININMEGKTFDKNFAKGLRISQNIVHKTTHNQTQSKDPITYYGLMLPQTDKIEIYKKIYRDGLHYFFNTLGHEGGAGLYAQQISNKKMNAQYLIQEHEDIFKKILTDNDQLLIKNKVIKNEQGLTMILSEANKSKTKERRLLVDIPVWYGKQGYIISMRWNISQDKPYDIKHVYNLLNTISGTDNAMYLDGVDILTMQQLQSLYTTIGSGLISS